MTRRAVPVLALLLALAVPAAAEVRLKVADMDPSAVATLGHWERFCLRIDYETDRPIRIRGDAYLGERRVTGINGGSPQYDAGTGEALVWFAYTEPARVDRIVVRAEDDRTAEVLAETGRPVRLEWTGRRGTDRARPAEWVSRLQAAHDARIHAQMEEASSREETPGEALVLTLVLWAAPAYFVLQLIALWRTRGGWRIAALVPAVPMLFVVGFTVLAFLGGSNLFPLVLIFASPPAAVYLILLLLVHQIAGR